MFANLAAYAPILLCLVLGAGLIIAELFMPGFGLPGVTGLVLIAAGIAAIWLESGALVAIATLLVVIALLAVCISCVMRSACNGEGSRVFLKDKEELRTREDMKVLVGRRGRTASVLRPSGIGDFDGVRLNVVTEGSFIERDMPIEIVSVDGARIVVRASQEG